MKALAREAELLPNLIGETCSHISIGAAGSLLICFASGVDENSMSVSGNDKQLTVECPWRIDSVDEVVAGYFDTDSERRSQVLIDRAIVNIESMPPSYMVKIDWDGGLSLWVFPCEAREFIDDKYAIRPWYISGEAIPGSP